MNCFFIKNLFCIACCILFYFTSNAQEIIYPTPAGLKPSAEYQVTINGKDAFVYASPVPAAYCSFDMSGSVEISIKANRDIKWVDVRPLSAGIKVNCKDSTITFKLTRPSQLSIELNGSIKMPLFIFANAPEKDKPSKTDPNVIFFEAGKIHNAGLIEIKSNQTVYIEGGAVVVGAILARGAKNIKIKGRGVLDGTWNIRFDDAIIKSGQFDKLPKELVSTDYEERHTINMVNCEGVTIEGITVHNSTRWTIVPVGCKKVTISNIKLVSDQPSDDGIDIAHCQQVWVHHCFIRTKDDCIAVKSYQAKPKGQDVDSVLVEQCVFWNALWGNGLEIGFELNSNEVRNVTFRNSDVIHVEAGAVFSIHNAGTATVKNILFEDIRVEDARQKLFDVAIFRSRYSEDGPVNEAERKRLYLNGAWDGVISVPADEKEAHAVFRGQIKNVVFRNISIVDGLFPFSVFYGYSKEKKVSNVTIENLKVHGKKVSSLKDAKLYYENADNIIVQ